MVRKENIKLVRGGRRRKEEEEGGEEGVIKHAMFISPTEPLLMTTDQTNRKEKAFCRRKVRCIAKVIRAGVIRFIWYYGTRSLKAAVTQFSTTPLGKLSLHHARDEFSPALRNTLSSTRLLGVNHP